MAEKNGVEAFGYEQELKRTLNFRDLVIYGLLFMGPMAVMTLYGIMTTISQGHTVLAGVIGCIAVLFTALSYGRMVVAFPVAGSTYSYTQRGINPKLGFLAGWVILLAYVFLPMLMYILCASYASALIPQIPFWVWVIIFVAPMTFISIRGMDVTSTVNMILYTAGIVAIVLFVILALKYGLTGHVTSLFSSTAIYNPKTFQFAPLMTAAVLAVASYLGFDAMTTLTEETEVSPKKIGKAIVIACMIQTVIYVLVAYFATLVMPDYTAITNPDTAFFEIAATVGGTWFQTLITIVIISSASAAALAGQTAASRVLYGMGRDTMIPAKFFAHLHPKYKTPVYSILVMAVLGLVGALTIDLNIAVEMITFGALFGFICVNLAVISHYFIRNKERRILANLVFPVLGTIICIYILLSITTFGKLVGFSWMGVGIVYLIVRSLGSSDFKALLEKNAFME